MRIRAVLAMALVVSACAEPSAEPTLADAPSSPPTVTPTPEASATRRSTPSPTPTASPTPSPEPAVLIAAGDIAACDVETDSATAALVAEVEGTLATLGDHVYPEGSDVTFAQCYDPVWGPFRDRTRPVLGNHDLQGDAGAAYHGYFGERAGTPGEGWYSYDLGDWHIVALNSNCELIACGPGSAQHAWLVADLAANPATCTLAYMHHPRFSSGLHGDYPPVGPLWEALDAAGVDVLLVGHDHMYERFAPQAATGAHDAAGIRQFTVGTGGYVLYQQQRVAANSEVVFDDVHGVLVMALGTDSYRWSFVTTDGRELDSGETACG